MARKSYQASKGSGRSWPANLGTRPQQPARRPARSQVTASVETCGISQATSSQDTSGCQRPAARIPVSGPDNPGNIRKTNGVGHGFRQQTATGYDNAVEQGVKDGDGILQPGLAASTDEEMFRPPHPGTPATDQNTAPDRGPPRTFIQFGEEPPHEAGLIRIPATPPHQVPVGIVARLPDPNPLAGKIGSSRQRSPDRTAGPAGRRRRAYSRLAAAAPPTAGKISPVRPASRQDTRRAKPRFPHAGQKTGRVENFSRAQSPAPCPSPWCFVRSLKSHPFPFSPRGPGCSSARPRLFAPFPEMSQWRQDLPLPDPWKNR